MIFPVITIRQPWAALIVRGIKDIENRNWRLPDKYRNCNVLVHASANPMFSVREAVREIAIRGLPAPISFPPPQPFQATSLERCDSMIANGKCIMEKRSYLLGVMLNLISGG